MIPVRQAGGADTDAREMVVRLLVASQASDDDTGIHMFRVGALCAALAYAVEENDTFCEHVFWAAPLHDVGKVGVPDAILRKPGKLSEEEWQVMRGHPQIGARILADASSPIIHLAALGALTHHERFDGSGYPARLRGEAIPLIGRLLAVADCYDALRMDRCYRKAWPCEQVLAHLSENSGSHYDPHLIDTFIAHERVFAQILEQINSTSVPVNMSYQDAAALSQRSLHAWQQARPALRARSPRRAGSAFLHAGL